MAKTITFRGAALTKNTRTKSANMTSTSSFTPVFCHRPSPTCLHLLTVLPNFDLYSYVRRMKAMEKIVMDKGIKAIEEREAKEAEARGLKTHDPQ